MNPEALIHIEQLMKKAPDHLMTEDRARFVADQLNSDDDFKHRYWSWRNVMSVLVCHGVISHEQLRSMH